MIYTINNCIRAFGYTNFDKLIADIGSVDGLKEYVIANGYADIAVAEDTELLLVDVNGKTWHTGCYGAVIEPPKPYLCFTSTGDSTVAITQTGTPNKSANKVIQYKLNNGQWQTWDLSAVTLADGDKMYLKSDDEIPVSEYYDAYKKFVMTGSIAASGNIMSLLNFSTTLTDYAFNDLFYGCASLTTAPELPATTLAQYCYSQMFYDCTSLTTTPELPATTLKWYCYYGMFSGCTSLTTAPALPAITLNTACYKSMFSGCTSLTTAPVLPVTTLAEECYYGMFNSCSSLTQAPELPATTLAEGCYNSMFERCTSLTQAPALPATTLADYCYNSMFWECTSLTQAPALPVTTLTASCYSYMFLGCTSLTTTPALPATTLQSSCYSNMFNGCTSLTTAPELPATTLTTQCYYWMFAGCTKLNYVKALFTDISAQECLENWLTNVSPTGTFVKNSAATWTNEQAKIPTGWTVQVEGGVTPEPEPERDYLCFTSTGDSTVAMTQTNVPTDISKNKVLQYKLNNGQWQTWDLSAVTLHDGDKMYLKSDDEIPTAEGLTHKRFSMTGSISASGNVMSLLNFSKTLTTYTFYGLFESCTALTTAPALPATTLENHCYDSMFFGCSALTTAPALPATTLATGCYSSMFNGCTSLVQAPELPATTLVEYCYDSMFQGCTKLNYVKAMFTTDPFGYVNYWLDGVSTTGIFVKNASATWSNTDANIPSGWTVQTASPDK